MGVQLAIDCFGWRKNASTKQHPILVTCPSILDATLCLSKIYESKLHGRKKKIVLTEFSPTDKEKEKKLWKKKIRYLQKGCIQN